MTMRPVSVPVPVAVAVAVPVLDLVKPQATHTGADGKLATW